MSYFLSLFLYKLFASSWDLLASSLADNRSEKTPPTTDGMFAWFKDFMRIPDDYVLNHQSLDQYLFLRFLKMITIMSVVGCIITWPLLFPINATGGGGQAGMDVLSISNVRSPNRFYAHAIAAWLFHGEWDIESGRKWS